MIRKILNIKLITLCEEYNNPCYFLIKKRQFINQIDNNIKFVKSNIFQKYWKIKKPLFFKR